MTVSYDWIMNHSGLPWLKLDVQVPTKEIYEELKNAELGDNVIYGESGYENYPPGTNLQEAGKIEKWTGFVLHGIDAYKPRACANYGYENEDDAPYQWTDRGEMCPKTKQFLIDNIPCKRFCRVRTQILGPGGFLNPHTDSDVSGLGLNISSPPKTRYLMLAAYWPKEVEFKLDEKVLPVEEGNIYMFDISKYHAVYNRSPEARWALGISADFSESHEWEDLVVRSYQKYGANA